MQTFAPRGKIHGPILPQFVLETSISFGAKVMYALLCNYASDNDHCWPSQATLAPMARSWAKPGGKRRRKLRRPGRSVIDATSATPWTMPVNMMECGLWKRTTVPSLSASAPSRDRSVRFLDHAAAGLLDRARVHRIELGEHRQLFGRQLRRLLEQLVSGYAPSGEIVDWVYLANEAESASAS